MLTVKAIQKLNKMQLSSESCRILGQRMCENYPYYPSKQPWSRDGGFSGKWLAEFYEHL